MHIVGYADDRPIATNRRGQGPEQGVEMAMLDRLPEK